MCQPALSPKVPHSLPQPTSESHKWIRCSPPYSPPFTPLPTPRSHPAPWLCPPLSPSSCSSLCMGGPRCAPPALWPPAKQRGPPQTPTYRRGSRRAGGFRCCRACGWRGGGPADGSHFRFSRQPGDEEEELGEEGRMVGGGHGAKGQAAGGGSGVTPGVPPIPPTRGHPPPPSPRPRTTLWGAGFGGNAGCRGGVVTGGAGLGNAGTRGVLLWGMLVPGGCRHYGIGGLSCFVGSLRLSGCRCL